MLIVCGSRDKGLCDRIHVTAPDDNIPPDHQRPALDDIRASGEDRRAIQVTDKEKSMAQPAQSKVTRRDVLKLAAGAAGVAGAPWDRPQGRSQADDDHVRARKLLREELRRALPE